MPDARFLLSDLLVQKLTGRGILGQRESAIKLKVESFKLAREDWESGSDQYLKRCG